MTIEAELFDGTVLEFPAGTDPAVIQRKVKELTAQKRGPQVPQNDAGVATGPATPAFADGDARNPTPIPTPATEDAGLIDSIFEGAGRGLQIGTQGAGRGVADIMGLPGDLSTGAANLGLAGVDNLAEMIMGDGAPAALDYRFPPSGLGSDAIAGVAGGVAETAGMDLIDPAEMSPVERFGYAANRFGAQGLVSGAGLAKMAPEVADTAAMARATGAQGSKADNMARALVAPYTQAPGRTLAGDTAAGVGAGVGVEAVDQFVPEDSSLKPLASLFAALTGGLGGAGISKAVLDGVPAAVSAARGSNIDFSLPPAADGTGQISKRVADATARVAQGMATDLPKARSTLADNLSSFPSPGAPKPSPMTMTEDPGLRGLERNFRASGDPAMSARMEAQDTGAMDYATERLLSILDEGADQTGALEAIRSRPGEIKTARDDAALPLLREAEASGVTVDAQPVADILDRALVGPKRPEVLTAIKAARDRLNVAGGDTLDTSVSGLYETRKALNDLIDGRSESNTGKFAQSELIAAKKALDVAIVKAEPRFGEYLDEYKAGSRPLDVFEGRMAQNLVENETDLRNVATKILSPSRYGTEKELGDVMAMIGDNPEAQRGWRSAVADVLVDRVTKNKAGEQLKPGQVVSVYNQHRETLAKVFTPEDMTALDEVHNLVRMMDTPQVPGRAPDLSGTRAVDPLSLVQAGLLASGKDMITTTMIMSRINFAARFLGMSQLTTPFKVNEVLARMQFDPDLAVAILNRPVAEGTGKTWSRDVQKMLAGGAAARDMAEDPEDEMTNVIMGDE